MKFHYIILTTLLLASITPCKSQAPTKKDANPAIKGCIVSSQLSNMPNFQVYYKGIQTESDSDGFFTLPLGKKRRNKYSLLICKDFDENFNSVNTIKNLSINRQKPFRYFKFTKATAPALKYKIEELEKQIKPFRLRLRLVNRQLEKQKKFKTKNLVRLKKRKMALTSHINKIEKATALFQKKHLAFQNTNNIKMVGDFWFIEEKNLEKEKSRIPKNCIILCLNPKVVDRIENWSFALPEKFVGLPKIILKKNLEVRNVKRKQSVTRSAYKSKISSLEKKVFHETIKSDMKVFENQPDRIVSLMR